MPKQMIARPRIYAGEAPKVETVVDDLGSKVALVVQHDDPAMLEKVRETLAKPEFGFFPQPAPVAQG